MSENLRTQLEQFKKIGEGFASQIKLPNTNIPKIEIPNVGN